MSKLWEAIKDLERERERTGEDGAREGNRRALATYLEEIRHRTREPTAAPAILASRANREE